MHGHGHVETCRDLDVVTDAWEAARPYLEKALDRCPTHTIEDVERDLLRHKAQFFSLGDAFVVTQVVEHPRRRVLRVWLAGGNLDTIRRALPELDNLARDWGCDRVEIDGRRGWARIMPEYDIERVVLTKDVD